MAHLSFVFENDLAKYRSMFEEYSSPPFKVQKNKDLCKQCVTSGWMYYLLDGMVKVYISNYDGSERIIDFIKGNTLIGMDCVRPGSKSVVSISCITDVHVLAFTTDILKKMLADNSEFAYDLVLYYGKVLRQVAYYSGILSISDLTTRLANFLFHFTDMPSYQQNNKITLTQAEMGAAINISRAQVAKILKQFREEGCLITGHRYITITDLEKLKKYCRF
ncbi:MAG: Crp/Fnr family transcriptional regulator [Eubacteriaceae bacterium]|jgi:CRP-like cAMP-binding protein|nr:Crp/Fnr family transcriptional regulator [Eubacteriaceae bacterium]